MLARTACALAFAAAFAPRLWATSVDGLEDIGPIGSTVSQRPIDGVVVTITVADNGYMAAGTYGVLDPLMFGGADNAPNAPLNPQNVSGSRFIRAYGETINLPTITFAFSVPVREFGITTIDLLETMGGTQDSVTMRALNAGGLVVQEETRVGPQGPSGFDMDWLLTSEAGDIVQVEILSVTTAYSGHAFDDILVSRTPLTFCDGSDGALASCPCSNPGSANTGCDIAQGTGGVSLSLLSQSTSPNGAILVGQGYSTVGQPTAIVIRSPALDPAGPVVFGDGLRCVSTTGLVRLAASVAVGGVSTHLIGHSAAAGPGTFYYQLWFRDTPSTYCDPLAAFNLSSGRTLVW